MTNKRVRNILHAVLFLFTVSLVLFVLIRVT